MNHLQQHSSLSFVLIAHRWVKRGHFSAESLSSLLSLTDRMCVHMHVQEDKRRKKPWLEAGEGCPDARLVPQLAY